ncbi:hypothetical protein, partial [Enterobacter sp. IF2SW-B1]|uniref:hypothetical protein n=1 Tax=Enterobacter sp. IF2SW-B1 TaxID=1841143 RepID=UPI000851BE3D
LTLTDVTLCLFKIFSSAKYGLHAALELISPFLVKIAEKNKIKVNGQLFQLQYRVFPFIFTSG